MPQPGVTQFSTRWELVSDLLEALKDENVIISIAQLPDDADIVLDELTQQGINLANEHECFVFVMGMCHLVEAELTSYQHGLLPRDELLSTVARMLGIFAIIRAFLPQHIFIRYLL